MNWGGSHLDGVHRVDWYEKKNRKIIFTTKIISFVLFYILKQISERSTWPLCSSAQSCVLLKESTLFEYRIT